MGCNCGHRALGTAHDQGPTFLLSFHASALGMVPDLLPHAERGSVLSWWALGPSEEPDW